MPNALNCLGDLRVDGTRITQIRIPVTVSQKHVDKILSCIKNRKFINQLNVYEHLRNILNTDTIIILINFMLWYAYLTCRVVQSLRITSAIITSGSCRLQPLYSMSASSNFNTTLLLISLPLAAIPCFCFYISLCPQITFDLIVFPDKSGFVQLYPNNF